MHELLGTASPPVRRFAIAFAGLGGFVLTGTLFLLLSRDDAPLLLLAIIPGALSAGAVAYATRERRPRRETMLAIVGRSVFAAILCPFVTAGVLLVISLLMGNGPGIVGGGEVAFYLCLGSAIASFFVAPLGAVFGVVYALVWQRLEATRAAGRSAHEQLWILFGMAFATLGIIDLLLSHTTWTPPFGSPLATTRSSRSGSGCSCSGC